MTKTNARNAKANLAILIKNKFKMPLFLADIVSEMCFSI